jgi:hypothetical protein
MRGNIVGLLAAALMAVCGVASANIIYNIDLSGGGETVTGTITTDGTLGVLTPASIVAWNLSAAGPIVLTVASPGNLACPGAAFGGCGVTALAAGTLVETGAGASAFLTFYGGAIGTLPFLSFLPSFVEVALSDSPHVTALIPTGQGAVLGTAAIAPPPPPASAPEPPTAILLAIGLVGLGSVYMRARGRQRAAV